MKKPYRTAEKIIENEIEYNIIEYPSGDKYWYYKDKIHRENGPAIERLNGSKHWFKHGKCHREDGPAIERYDGTKEYWLDGIYYPNVFSPEELLIASIIE